MTRRLLLFLPAFGSLARAHDLLFRVERDRPKLQLTAGYGPGEPAASANVAVLDPNGSQEPLLVGKTNAEGVFQFEPPGEGTFLIRVDDGYGHLEQRTIAVDWTADPEPESAALGPAIRVGAGLSVIAAGTVLFAWRRRKRENAAPKAGA